MRLLLDSHVLVWWVTDDPRLRPGARQLIAESEAVVSIASYWELGIKIAARRMPSVNLMGELTANDFDVLPITLAHAEEAGRLPYLHGDPFDRMLIAQARLEELTLLTDDAKVRAYDVATIPARA
ncbi:MAG: type II toxin-antitoxin system VapC family toxin [Parcubacteria group bacterium]